MEIQDVMIDDFPEEFEQVRALLAGDRFHYSQETVQRAFRMVLAGSIARYSLRPDESMPNMDDPNDVAAFRQRSRQEVQRILRHQIRHKIVSVLNLARMADLNLSEHELVELTRANMWKKQQERGFLKSIQRTCASFIRRWTSYFRREG